MEFRVDSIDNLHVSDDEIFILLSHVYVQSGFATVEMAKTVFDPIKVRDRGVMFVSKEVSENIFSGMVVVVPPSSSAIVRAKGNECEMHLLGVSPKYRGHSLGRNLVRSAIDFAKENKW
ncbi:GNAT family N-acetyltransferase [Pseudomonas sp. HK3]